MTDRPFDRKLALMGTTAGMWPDDVVEHGGIVEAQAEAIAMSADAMKNKEVGADEGEEDTAGLNYRPDARGSGARGNGAGVDRSSNFSGTSPY